MILTDDLVLEPSAQMPAAVCQQNVTVGQNGKLRNLSEWQFVLERQYGCLRIFSSMRIRRRKTTFIHRYVAQSDGPGRYRALVKKRLCASDCITGSGDVRVLVPGLWRFR